MKISNESLKSIYFGAYSFCETEDGYLKAFQHTKEQMEYFKKTFNFWYVRSDASNAKTLEFKTDATKISFEYKIAWIGSLDTIEISVNGLLYQLFDKNTLKDEGRVTFNLPDGEKDIVIYLTADSTLLIRNFEINGDFIPAKKGAKVLWLGDSITQGYGPFRSAHTYVSVANRYLNYDIINQGIGGYKYDEFSLMEMPGYKPDKIIVSLGTNQYSEDYNEVIENYYKKLHELYGNTPVLCITPLWRFDKPSNKYKMVELRDKIMSVCANYPNISIVDGFKLVPCLDEYFIDKLHPNALGCEMYGRNLVNEIQKLRF